MGEGVGEDDGVASCDEVGVSDGVEPWLLVLEVEGERDWLMLVPWLPVAEADCVLA